MRRNPSPPADDSPVAEQGRLNIDVIKPGEVEGVVAAVACRLLPACIPSKEGSYDPDACDAFVEPGVR